MSRGFQFLLRQAPVSKMPLAYVDAVLRTSDIDLWDEVTGKVSFNDSSMQLMFVHHHSCVS